MTTTAAEASLNLGRAVLSIRPMQRRNVRE